MPSPVVFAATLVAAVAAAVDAATASAPGDLELIWVSQGCRPGDGLMVVGWGKLFANATVLVDGVPSPTLGRSSAAIITTVPATAAAGRHTITLHAGSITSTGSLGLNDPELWWCQGDEGQNATQNGWVRCFGQSNTVLHTNATKMATTLVSCAINFAPPYAHGHVRACSPATCTPNQLGQNLGFELCFAPSTFGARSQNQNTSRILYKEV